MIITGAKTPIDDLVGDNLWGGERLLERERL